MRKLFALIASLAVLSFSGCSSANVEPESTASSLEGTKVSTYLVGDYISVDEAKSKLQSAGFEVIATYPSVSKGTTIVFTNEALKTEAAKPGRAFAAVLRLFVDDKEKMISFTNPIYFGKAFMQDEYNHVVFNSALESINTEFADLKGSKDELEFDKLAGYHFMLSTPYYEDTVKLGKKCATTEDAVKKAESYKKGKAIVFELKLSDTSVLLGYDLKKRTKKFVKKIGRANAAILPYCVAIENGQAVALDAEYYIAISYPLLNLGKFMGISTVPGAINKDLEKAFKK
jgi:hypothetical protein